MVSTDIGPLTIEDIRQLLGDVLGLGDRAGHLRLETPLLGHLPELDSMAIITVVTAIEEQLGISMQDEDISGETFETVGSLLSLLQARQN